MRRSIGSLILTLGLLFGWGATIIHLTQLSLFRTGRLEQASSALLANSSVRGALANSLDNSLTPFLGSTLNIPTGTFRNIINTAATNPNVKAQFANAMNSAQAHLLGKSFGPITIGGQAFSQVVAAGIQPYSSQAATTIAQQGLSITVPGSALPNLGRYARNASKAESLLISGALICVLLALLIHPSRGSVIRRVGFWMVGMSIVNALIFWFIPTYLLPQIGFSWAQIASVVLKAVAGPATTFYVELLGVGALVVALGEGVKKIA